MKLRLLQIDQACVDGLCQLQQTFVWAASDDFSDGYSGIVQREGEGGSEVACADDGDIDFH